MRVLYVEDDPGTASAVEMMLRQEGHLCDKADHGKAAVDLAKRGDYDIILLDIMLPDIDGYEVIHRLRVSGVRTPFLIQTGLVDRNNNLDALGFGVGDYLIKPFNKAELMARIDAVIARREPAPGPEKELLAEPQEAPLEQEDERRRHRRFATVKNAKILYHSGIDCVVLNISHSGAALRLPKADTQVPDRFPLVLAPTPPHDCALCWRYKDKIGVRFLDSEPQ